MNNGNEGLIHIPQNGLMPLDGHDWARCHLYVDDIFSVF